MRRPRVFLSYSRDSSEHDARVLALTQELRAGGIDAWLDRFESAPPEGWPRWMQQQIEQADFVIGVCTPLYRWRFEALETPQPGLGPNWEGLFVYQSLQQKRKLDRMCVPVVFRGAESDDCVPALFSGGAHYVLPDQVASLSRRLRASDAGGEETREDDSAQGPLPPAEVKSDGATASLVLLDAIVERRARAQAAQLLAWIGARAELFNKMDQELWTDVFPALERIVAELHPVAQQARSEMQREIGVAANFLCDAVQDFVVEYQGIFERFMQTPAFAWLEPVHRERNWPELGRAAQSLIRVRRLLDATVRTLNGLVDASERIEWRELSMESMLCWVSYAQGRRLCPACGSNLQFSRSGQCPRCSKPNAVFVLSGHSDARHVAVAGSFNEWKPTACAKQGDSEWTLQQRLPTGRYSYKFVVDGEWLLDPGNPLTERDREGNTNSVLVAS